MIKLHANADAVTTLLGFLNGTPDQIAFLQGVVQQHGATPGDFYANNPDAARTFAELQQLPAFQAQDWSRLAHPHVMAQLLVDLCEKSAQALPDGLHVAVNGEWQPLNAVQPTWRAEQAAPAIPAAPPAPAPAPQQDPFPQPERLAATPPPPTALQLQPEPEAILDAEFSDSTAMVTRDVMGAQVSMPAQTAQHIDTARQAAMAQPIPSGFNTPAPPPSATLATIDALLQAQQLPQAQQAAPAPVQAQPQAVAMPVQAQAPASPEPTIAGAGQFGLPQPFMSASKGNSVFDKDPGGEPPKGVSPRQVRDLMALMPHLFAAPAGDVVGKGTGSVQRHRLYTSALLLLHTALSSVPDKNASVGYLLWHLEHLRYNASQTAGGQTMLTYETWLFKDGAE